MEDRIKQINRNIKVLNVLLLIILIFTGISILSIKTDINIPLMIENPKIQVVSENILKGQLRGKTVEVISLHPLKVKIPDEDICIEKTGKWEMVENKGIVFVSNEKEGLFIQGIKRN